MHNETENVTERLIQKREHIEGSCLATRYLFGFVSQATGLVRTGRSGDTHNRRKLAILPAPDPQQEPHNIRLFLPP